MAQITIVTNTLDTTKLDVIKAFDDKGNEAQRPDNVTVQLQRKTAKTAWIDVAAQTKTIDINKTDASFKAEFADLPKTELATGDAYEYRAIETKITYKTLIILSHDVDAVTTDGGENGAVGAYTYTSSTLNGITSITNKMETVGVDVRKKNGLTKANIRLKHAPQPLIST
ncbi:MAG: Cna B-type domain-containing protein [Clostridia bacterium]|nr:Cna B-type domain-containing protein [Clostridia bacterium]NLS85095.1 Cna B-type domain-containing protein [Oscillospiraceae bacterium]